MRWIPFGAITLVLIGNGCSDSHDNPADAAASFDASMSTTEDDASTADAASPSDAGPADGGSPRGCIPATAVACECPAGRTGMRYCNDHRQVG